MSTTTLPEDMRERVRAWAEDIGFEWRSAYGHWQKKITTDSNPPLVMETEELAFFYNICQEVRRKSQLSEEHYWIDRYSREIKSFDGSEPIELRERNCLKDIRRQHQNRAIELQSLNKESKNDE